MASPFLHTLPQRLLAALSAGDLDEATLPPDGAGITRSLRAGYLRIDLRLVADALPRVTLDIDPPADATELCAAWAIARPLAVSPDVEQRTWQIFVAGDDLPDPHSRRVASETITAGRWDIRPRLVGRPAGPLPGVVSGASPAYDVRERGGAVRSIEIAPTAHMTRVLEPGHGDVRALLGATAAAHPERPAGDEGRSVDPAASFVALYDVAGAVAGAALTDAGGGEMRASHLCVVPGPRGAHLGAALLDTLEAVARERGAARLRLDCSASRPGDALPYARLGYAVAPADAGIWAEKHLPAARTEPTTP